ncbi:MAG TPA: DinB family protein [Vicinamibacterales bacterium]|jgi:uncharacterized damage-inducible protein DinB|nr:DinB family protein [Vicinamibacterales bacterium]
MKHLASLVILFAVTSTASAQPANPLSTSAKRTYDIIKNYLTKAAAKVPEEHYSFKPTPDVRSFGQIVGHIADANYGFCSAVAGEKPPVGGFAPDAVSVEKTKTSKADLEKALAESFAYCDKVHAGMTDAAGSATIKFFTGEMAKLSILEFNTHHDFEHYGNLVTYMRLKGIVPPSSEPRTGG